MSQFDRFRSLTFVLGLTTFTTPYFINVENLNWGAKYLYIWAGSNLITFGRYPSYAYIVFAKL